MVKLTLAELADLAGVTRETLSDWETDTVTPRKATAEAVRAVLHGKGIEFLDYDGVRRRPDGIDILQGQEGFEQFYDRVYLHVKHHGGSICVSGVDEALFAKHHGPEHSRAHLERMTALCQSRHDISFKILIKEGDANFLASTYATYRWQPREHFSPTPFYLFGDRLALITFDADPAPKILLIRSAVFADAYRKQFQIAWEAAKDPPQKRRAP
jgi:DNA-binding XRE family transcriptional regulator